MTSVDKYLSDVLPNYNSVKTKCKGKNREEQRALVEAELRQALKKVEV